MFIMVNILLVMAAS